MEDHIVPPHLGLFASHNIPGQLGGFPGLGEDRAEATRGYLRPLQPYDRFYVIGDKLSRSRPGKKER